MASKACDAVMLAVKTSQLAFVIQETPYSSFVTIRKKFQKGFNPKEKEAQLELTKEDSIMLQEKLEKAEKGILKA